MNNFGKNELAQVFWTASILVSMQHMKSAGVSIRSGVFSC